jgi:hypothetical protein
MVRFGFHLFNLTSDICNGPLRYNGLVPDLKPFRLTESVKAAG